MGTIWNLKNITTGEIINVSKSIFKVGRNIKADLISESDVLSRNHATLSVLIDGLYLQDNKVSNHNSKYVLILNRNEFIKLFEG